MKSNEPRMNGISQFSRSEVSCFNSSKGFDLIMMLNTREMGTLETTWSSYFTHCLVYQSEDYFIQNYEEGEPTRCASEGVDIRIMGYMISNMVFFIVTNNLLCVLSKVQIWPTYKIQTKAKVCSEVIIRNTRVHPDLSGHLWIRSVLNYQTFSFFEKIYDTHSLSFGI